MAGEFNDQIRRQLIQIFASSLSNSPGFSRTAEFGGHRSADEGIQNLLPDRYSLFEKKRRLKGAIVDFLVSGGVPSVEAARGDAKMQMDAALYFHSHISVVGVPLFVKVLVEDVGKGEIEATVINLHKQD